MSKFFDQMEAYARADTDDDRERIEQTVWELYGIDQTVCIHDMSGFSRLTEKHGIVHYLSMVRHMRVVVQPIIERFGGHVVKFEADNTYARFPDPHSAIQSSVAINIAFDAMNMMTTEDLNIYISSGIDCGKFLLIDGNDFFGAPINTASKLGEDIGSGGDILVAEAAMKLVPAEAAVKSEKQSFDISGISIPAHRITY